MRQSLTNEPNYRALSAAAIFCYDTRLYLKQQVLKTLSSSAVLAWLVFLVGGGGRLDDIGPAAAASTTGLWPRRRRHLVVAVSMDPE